MFDQGKAGLSQNCSHSRGVLIKQMYSTEKQQLERKRREMKAILDKQVEQRRKKKQIQKMQQQKLNKMEQQKIKAYYMKLETRDKVNASVGSKKLSMKEKSDSDHKGKRVGRYTQKTIPVVLVEQSEERQNQLKKHSNVKSIGKFNKVYHNSVGNLPLLDISPGQQENKRRSRKIVKPKLQNKKTRKIGKNSLLDYDEPQKSSEKQTFGEINEELECENNELKDELKKNQEALTLLLGAVKSNKKMQKYKMKAESILYGKMQKKDKKQTSIRVEADEKEQSMLPLLKVQHQSIMHDFMFGNAKKASIRKLNVYQ